MSEMAVAILMISVLIGFGVYLHADFWQDVLGAWNRAPTQGG